MDEHTKEVYYWKYCESCAYYKNESDRGICNDCLTQGWNVDSHKPINYKEKT